MLRFPLLGLRTSAVPKHITRIWGVVCAARILNAASSSDETSYFSSTVAYNKDQGAFVSCCENPECCVCPVMGFRTPAVPKVVARVLRELFGSRQSPPSRGYFRE